MLTEVHVKIQAQPLILHDASQAGNGWFQMCMPSIYINNYIITTIFTPHLLPQAVFGLCDAVLAV